MKQQINIPGYDDLKLIHSGFEEEIYSVNVPNILIKVFYHDDNNDNITSEICHIYNTLSKLLPKYVPHIYQEFKTDNYTSLIMENINGCVLKNYLRNESININVISTIVHNLINAVNALHDCGYAHGDLHSENIIVTDTYDVKLIDFGNSEYINKNPNHKYVTKLIYFDLFELKNHIMDLIFPTLPRISYYNLMKGHIYDIQDVIGYKSNTEMATTLYECLNKIQISYYESDHEQYYSVNTKK